MRRPSRELVTDRSPGVQLATIQELIRYWAIDSVPGPQNFDQAGTVDETISAHSGHSQLIGRPSRYVRRHSRTSASSLA
jgi:hypothetical protein